MSRRAAHLFDGWTWPVCRRCGRKLEGVTEPCRFGLLIPPTPMGRRSGWPRLRREWNRLHDRGLVSLSETINVVRGHVRPWPPRQETPR